MIVEEQSHYSLRLYFTSFFFLGSFTESEPSFLLSSKAICSLRSSPLRMRSS